MTHDLHEWQTGGADKKSLMQMITQRQSSYSCIRLNAEVVQQYYQRYSRFQELLRLAIQGAHCEISNGFKYNKGCGDDLVRPSIRRYSDNILFKLMEMQVNGWCLILPASCLEGMEGLHCSPLHIVARPGDSKSRLCIDMSSSELNSGHQSTEFLFEDVEELMQLPTVRNLCTLLDDAAEAGASEIFKTDVASAFRRFKLSPTMALLQATKIEDYIIVPLVGMFGWSLSPAFYQIISQALHWAHNGGLTREVLDRWRCEVALPPASLPHLDRSHRSITYVDDTTGWVHAQDPECNLYDMIAIVKTLLGKDSINLEKTEGPTTFLTTIGWQCCMTSRTIRPSERGINKMLYWLFKRVSGTYSILTHDLHQLVSLLVWYSQVVPIGRTYVSCLYADLNRAIHSPKLLRWVRLSRAAREEITFWRCIMQRQFYDNSYLCCPFWMLKDKHDSNISKLTLYCDASTSIGGGYVIDKKSFDYWQWSSEEMSIFITNKIDINLLEFATIILALKANEAILKGCLVHVWSDNMSATTWAHHLRSAKMKVQKWMRFLIEVLLENRIVLDVNHIAGVDNVVADRLSRNAFVQDTELIGSERVPVMTSIQRMTLWRQ